MTDDWTVRAAPSLDDIDAMARAACAALPDAYRPAAAEVSLRIEDFAPHALLYEIAIEDPFGLTWLYDGIPMIGKSVMDQPHGPDTIWLSRRPILDEWGDRGTVTLGALVAHVYVHELAHHSGWSDAAIAEIDPWWEGADTPRAFRCSDPTHGSRSTGARALFRDRQDRHRRRRTEKAGNRLSTKSRASEVARAVFICSAEEPDRWIARQMILISA